MGLLDFLRRRRPATGVRVRRGGGPTTTTRLGDDRPRATRHPLAVSPEAQRCRPAERRDGGHDRAAPGGTTRRRGRAAPAAPASKARATPSGGGVSGAAAALGQAASSVGGATRARLADDRRQRLAGGCAAEVADWRGPGRRGHGRGDRDRAGRPGRGLVHPQPRRGALGARCPASASGATSRRRTTPVLQFGVGAAHAHARASPTGATTPRPTQEGFLVLSGECIAIVEGEERRMRQWDYLHCPPGTRHITVGAGDGAVRDPHGRHPRRRTSRSRVHRSTRSPPRYGARSRATTNSSKEAYADLARIVRPRPGPLAAARLTARPPVP